MKFRYTPASASSREWDFDPDKMFTLGEAGDIEHRCRPLTFDECKMAIIKGSASVRIAFLFVLLKRENPKVKFETLRDTTYPGEVEVAYDVAEMVEIRAEFARQLDAGEAEDPAAVRSAIEILDNEIEEQGGVPEVDEADTEDEPAGPKDLPGTSSESSGGLHSLPSSTSTPATSTA